MIFFCSFPLLNLSTSQPSYTRGYGQHCGAKKDACNEDCCKKTATVKKVAMTCKLTTPELRERKNTVIASLLISINRSPGVQTLSALPV